MIKKFSSVDVIVPLFNDSRNIKSSIDSLLNQTYPIDNIFIVDDGSTDGSAEVVQDLYFKENKIKLIKIQHKGIGGARNAGLRVSTSEFVAFLDSDDIWTSDKLMSQMSLFQEQPNLGAIYCGYCVMDDGGIPRPERWVMEPILKGNIFSALLEGNQISGSASAVVVKRAYLNIVGGFDEDLLFCEDWDMWLRLSKICTFSFVNKKLVYVRQKNQINRENLRRLWSKYDYHLRMWSKWPKEVSKNREVNHLILHRCYLNYCTKSNHSLIRNIKIAFLMDRRFRFQMHPKIYRSSIGSILNVLYKISYYKFRRNRSWLIDRADAVAYATKIFINKKLSVLKKAAIRFLRKFIVIIIFVFSVISDLKKRITNVMHSFFGKM